MSLEAAISSPESFKNAENLSEIENQLLHEFLTASEEQIQAVQLAKIPGAWRSAASVNELTRKRDEKLEAFIRVYALSHGELRTNAKRTDLLSGAISRGRFTNAAYHFYGKIISKPMAMAGRKGVEIAMRHSEAARESARVRKFIEITSKVALAVAVGSVAVVVLGHATPTMLAVKAGSILGKMAVFGYGGKIALPKALSFLPYMQRHPEKLAEWRKNIGWIGFIGGAVAGAYLAWLTMPSDDSYSDFGLKSPEENLNGTAHNIASGVIEEERGSSRFLPPLHSKTLDDAVNGMAFNTARFDSRANGLYERLCSVESKTPRLLNDGESSELVSRGTELLERLDTAKSDEFEHLAREADAWNREFDRAAEIATEEKNKNALELGYETFGTHRAPFMQNVEDTLGYYPAHISGLPLTGEHVTPESIIESEANVKHRLDLTNDMLANYERVVESTSTLDYDHQNLIDARDYYQQLYSDVHALRFDIDGLPLGQGHVISHHDSAFLFGEDRADNRALSDIHHIDSTIGFEKYQSYWNKVLHANARAERIQDGYVGINGNDMPIRDEIPVKEGVHTEGLGPGINRAILHLENFLRGKGDDPEKLSEGHKLTAFHKSECHHVGLCVDFPFPDPKTQYHEILGSHPGDYLLYEALDKETLNEKEEIFFNYLYTEHHMTRADADAWLRDPRHGRVEFKVETHATAPNFHYAPAGVRPDWADNIR